MATVAGFFFSKMGQLIAVSMLNYSKLLSHSYLLFPLRHVTSFCIDSRVFFYYIFRFNICFDFLSWFMLAVRILKERISTAATADDSEAVLTKLTPPLNDL